MVHNPPLLVMAGRFKEASERVEAVLSSNQGNRNEEVFQNFRSHRKAVNDAIKNFNVLLGEFATSVKYTEDGSIIDDHSYPVFVLHKYGNSGKTDQCIWRISNGSIYLKETVFNQFELAFESEVSSFLWIEHVLIESSTCLGQKDKSEKMSIEQRAKPVSFRVLMGLLYGSKPIDIKFSDLVSDVRKIHFSHSKYLKDKMTAIHDREFPR